MATPPDPNDTHSILNALPFIGMALSSGEGQGRVFTRLVEAAIIGGVVTWGTVQVLGADIDWLKQSVTELKADLKELRRDVYRDR